MRNVKPAALAGPLAGREMPREGVAQVGEGKTARAAEVEGLALDHLLLPEPVEQPDEADGGGLGVDAGVAALLGDLLAHAHHGHLVVEFDGAHAVEVDLAHLHLAPEGVPNRDARGGSCHAPRDPLGPHNNRA